MASKTDKPTPAQGRKGTPLPPDKPGTAGDFRLPDAAVLSQNMAAIAERSQRIVADFLKRQGAEGGAGGAKSLDPLNLGHAFFEMTARLMANPAKLMQAQFSFWQDYMTLWQNTARRMMGDTPAAPVAAPAPGDKRFKDEAWQENEVFDFIKQSYLLSARWMQGLVRDVEGLDDKAAQKVDFYTRQFVDALAPSNFLMTNPEVLRKTAETGGENLLKGLNNLLADLERGRGKLSIKMTDPDAFRIGQNIAVSPGKVVYQNALMQLVQYTPTTETVLRRPLLVVPPWINKFYILDLRPKNSFVRWAVSQGHTVFVVSWVNPGEDLHAKNFEDYMQEGVLDALGAIEQATGETDVNAIGYCLGGTLLGATLAYMATKHDTRIKSATFFTTMLDFAQAGELSVFIDEEQLKALEEKMDSRGYLDGAEMATTFNMLRANDLIWSFVVNNYLLGQEPFPFDLLYWNSDSTRMPATMHSFYLRKMYQENRLAEPGGITLAGVPIDLGLVTLPTYFLSTREDHIAPWTSTYAGMRRLGSGRNGNTRFVLAASGHIAGVVNPPEAGKYSHWTASAKADALPDGAEAWFNGATELSGSWWPDWQRWVSDQAKATVPARTPGDGNLTVIEDAPGSYVQVRGQ